MSIEEVLIRLERAEKKIKELEDKNYNLMMNIEYITGWIIYGHSRYKKETILGIHEAISTERSKKTKEIRNKEKLKKKLKKKK